MEIPLPYARPEYPWLKRGAIHVFNFEAWFAPAVADALADDVGDEYQSAVITLVIMTVLVAFVLTFIVIFLPLPLSSTYSWGTPCPQFPPLRSYSVAAMLLRDLFND